MAAGISLFVFLFVFTEQFTAGFRTGLLNCARIVIPSLFPFLVSSSLAGSGDLPKLLKQIAEPVTQKLFLLPSEALPAIILSQFGGYLSGAKAVDSLCRSGTLSPSQGARLLLFSVNAGMGFAVNAVGNIMLGSREIGRILLFSLCVSSLAAGILTRFIPENELESPKMSKKHIGFSQAVVESVSQSASAMLSACGFVCVFSGICSVIEKYIKDESLALFISCLLEITNGCVGMAGKVSLPLIAAACAFGGVCVHLQIFAVSKNLPVKIPAFYLFRLIHAALAYAVCAVTLHFHPVEAQVFLTFSQNAALWSFSAPAAVSLLFLSALLILDLDNGRKIC